VLTTGTFLNGLIYVGHRTFQLRYGLPRRFARLASRPAGSRPGRRRASTGAQSIILSSNASPAMTGRCLSRSRPKRSTGRR
jgi:tRNA U34 5-carboxymethylaminomethyl modifying enzyme MnmG/GidA